MRAWRIAEGEERNRRQKSQYRLTWMKRGEEDWREQGRVRKGIEMGIRQEVKMQSRQEQRTHDKTRAARATSSGGGNENDDRNDNAPIKCGRRPSHPDPTVLHRSS